VLFKHREKPFLLQRTKKHKKISETPRRQERQENQG